MEDYKTVGAQVVSSPYYLENVRRYIGDWKAYWGEFIPEMISSKAVPDGATWGSYPVIAPGGSSTACLTYNVMAYCFTPTALSGMIFIAGDTMGSEGESKNFGPEMSALINGYKAQFKAEDIPFIYTQPSKTLSPAITVPKAIKGKAVAVEVSDWADLTGVIEAAVK